MCINKPYLKKGYIFRTYIKPHVHDNVHVAHLNYNITFHHHLPFQKNCLTHAQFYIQAFNFCSKYLLPPIPTISTTSLIQWAPNKEYNFITMFATTIKWGLDVYISSCYRKHGVEFMFLCESIEHSMEDYPKKHVIYSMAWTHKLILLNTTSILNLQFHTNYTC